MLATDAGSCSGRIGSSHDGHADRTCVGNADLSRHARGAAGALMVAAVSRRPGRIQGTCHYCPEVATSRDHIVPLSLGGPMAQANIVMACGPCNVRKGNGLTTCECAKCADAVAAWWPASVAHHDRGACRRPLPLTQRIELPAEWSAA